MAHTPELALVEYRVPNSFPPVAVLATAGGLASLASFLFRESVLPWVKEHAVWEVFVIFAAWSAREWWMARRDRRAARDTPRLSLFENRAQLQDAGGMSAELTGATEVWALLQGGTIATQTLHPSQSKKLRRILLRKPESLTEEDALVHRMTLRDMAADIRGSAESLSREGTVRWYERPIWYNLAILDPNEETRTARAVRVELVLPYVDSRYWPSVRVYASTAPEAVKALVDAYLNLWRPPVAPAAAQP